ncbi:hypothetical protein T439DRAFT_329164 [Meredithblackwellia eburnea MCA 4105]
MSSSESEQEQKILELEERETKKRKLDDQLGPKQEDKGKLKKKHKQLQKQLDNPPSFLFDTRGFKGQRQIQTKDIRDLVLHLLSDEKAQNWLYVENKRNIRHVVLLLAPGLPLPPSLASTPLSANLPLPIPSGADLPVLSKLFSHACPVKAPGDKGKLHSVMQNLLNVPITGAEKERRERERKKKGQEASTSNPAAYILTPSQLQEAAYPVAEPATSGSNNLVWKKRDANGWISTPYHVEQELGRTKKMLGVDCEMCLTEAGSELARISICDENGQSIYDQLVRPSKPVLDYLTQYSGITEQKLKNVTTTLDDVQDKLMTLVDHDTILVGHSLECDLRVLKLAHPYVIDTSLIYQHPRGPPYKASLKWLAQKWLKLEIQQSSSSGGQGHNSLEDASTAVKLVRLKMEKGPGFGDFKSDEETIFERLGRVQGGPDGRKCRTAMIDQGNPAQWLGGKASNTVACKNDDEVLQGLIEQIPQNELTVARLMDVSHGLGWSTPTSNQPTISDTIYNGVLSTSPQPSKISSSPSTLFSALNSQLSTLHSSLPPLTALVVLTGHGDPRPLSALNAKKVRFEKMWKEGKKGEETWLEEEERQLETLARETRRGWAFFCVKQ